MFNAVQRRSQDDRGMQRLIMLHRCTRTRTRKMNNIRCSARNLVMPDLYSNSRNSRDGVPALNIQYQSAALMIVLHPCAEHPTESNVTQLPRLGMSSSMTICRVAVRWPSTWLLRIPPTLCGAAPHICPSYRRK
jgi:hypothetical protein